MAETERQAIVIGGRRFVAPPYTTVEHDLWIMDQIRRAGLDTVARGADESPEDFVDRLLRELIASGALLMLMGGMMLPDDDTRPEDWTPALAERQAEFLGRCHAPADKQAIYDQVVALLLGFFEAGAISIVTSQRSSTRPTDAEDAATAES